MNDNFNPNWKNNSKIPYFRRCVIQNFPFIEKDFDAVTDYQLLSKVVAYLNKVIEQQNITTDNTNELYRVYELLKNYVEHYFENLDVQEEINNKLDEMVEDGTLQEIIAEYLNANALWCFNTVAEMKEATNLINGSYAKTLGFHSINDGGAATYKIREITENDTIDEMFILSFGRDNLIAELIVDKNIYPEQAGAYGDGIHDDSNIFTACLSKGLTINCYPKTYAITRVTLPFKDININGNGCTFKNIKLDMSEWATGVYSYHSISSMFSNDIPNENDTTNYNNCNLNNFTIDQDSNNVTGLNNEMHWGGLFTPILLIGCKNITLENIKSYNSLQTPFYFYGAKNIFASNCIIENVGNNANLNTGSRNCFEMPMWNGVNNNCKFEVTNTTAYNIHDEFSRNDTCEYANITNCIFDLIGGTIIESHSYSDRQHPSTKYFNISNTTNNKSKGLVHINEEISKAQIKINNVNNINSDGSTNLYGVVYLKGDINCNISDSLFTHTQNKYSQGYFNISEGSNLTINNSVINMPLQTPVIRNYNTAQSVILNNCDINSGNLIRFENGGYLNIFNSKINSDYFITGTANSIKIKDSNLIIKENHGIQPSMTNGYFELSNSLIESDYNSPFSFISLAGSSLNELIVNNVIVKSTNITRVRFLPVVKKIQFVNNFVDADSQAFTGDRALQENCLSIFTNNICNGTTFGITGTPTISANNHNFDIS